MAQRDFGRDPRSRKIPPRCRRYAGARTRARSHLQVTNLNPQYFTDRPLVVFVPATFATPSIFHTNVEREKSPISNGLPENSSGVPRRTFSFKKIIFNKSPLHASNVHRFASQFACTFGKFINVIIILYVYTQLDYLII